MLLKLGVQKSGSGFSKKQQRISAVRVRVEVAAAVYELISHSPSLRFRDRARGRAGVISLLPGHTSHQLATYLQSPMCGAVQRGAMRHPVAAQNTETQCGVAQYGVAHGARKSQLTSSAPHGSVTVRVKKKKQPQQQ